MARPGPTSGIVAGDDTSTFRTIAAAGLTVVIASLTGCIAPDVEMIGALGVTVDQRQRPVLVVEACKGAATEVRLSFDREGLTDGQDNEQVAKWKSDSPVRGSSELVLHAPAGPWSGQPVELVVDRGYIATAIGDEDREVLSMVAFHGKDLARMKPGTVYINDSDPDRRELLGRSVDDFSSDPCR